MKQTIQINKKISRMSYMRNTKNNKAFGRSENTVFISSKLYTAIALCLLSGCIFRTQFFS